MISHPDLYRTGSFFEIYLTTNEGIAFSIPLTGPLLYIALAVLVAASIYYGKQFLLRTIPAGILAGLFIGGGLGNILDRVRLGYVIDFVKLGPWPLFNVADIALTCGVLFLILKRKTLLTQEDKE